jgi:hypothetical protein
MPWTIMSIRGGIETSPSAAVVSRMRLLPNANAELVGSISGLPRANNPHQSWGLKGNRHRRL